MVKEQKLFKKPKGLESQLYFEGPDKNPYDPLVLTDFEINLEKMGKNLPKDLSIFPAIYNQLGNILAEYENGQTTPEYLLQTMVQLKRTYEMLDQTKKTNSKLEDPCLLYQERIALVFNLLCYTKNNPSKIGKAKEYRNDINWAYNA